MSNNSKRWVNWGIGLTIITAAASGAAYAFLGHKSSNNVQSAQAENQSIVLSSQSTTAYTGTSFNISLKLSKDFKNKKISARVLYKANNSKAMNEYSPTQQYTVGDSLKLDFPIIINNPGSFEFFVEFTPLTTTNTIMTNGVGIIVEGAPSPTERIDITNNPDFKISGLENQTFIYDKTKKEPNVTVSYKGVVLDNQYYLKSFRDNTDAGTAKLIIEGKAPFYGTREVPFTIYKAINRISDFTIKNNEPNATSQFPGSITYTYYQDKDCKTALPAKPDTKGIYYVKAQKARKFIKQ